MLRDLFPRVHRSYTSLPVLGSTLDGFAQFLVELGYPQLPVLQHVRTARHVDTRLQRRGCRAVAHITRAKLRACAPPAGRSQEDMYVAATVRLLVLSLTIIRKVDFTQNRDESGCISRIAGGTSVS